MNGLSALDFGFRPRRIADANVQIAELEVLRHDADLCAPEAAGLAEPLVSDYRAIPSSGDHLRLPVCSNRTAPQLQRAVDRFLATQPAPHACEETAMKETQLHRLLGALRCAQQRIRRGV